MSDDAQGKTQSLSNLNLASYSDSARSSLYTNIDVLRIQHINESRNYTCQAQNLFGLVLFNMSLIIKGNLREKKEFFSPFIFFSFFVDFFVQ
jgi:hypothetical protein